jgi:hypothetical protein
MRRRARRAKVAAVEPPLHIDLLLQRGADPVAGWLNAAGQPPLEFSGYLELMALLERFGSDGRVEREAS